MLLLKRGIVTVDVFKYDTIHCTFCIGMFLTTSQEMVAR
jgi:hypothetical protein